MLKKVIFLAALLPLISGLAVADDLSGVSDKDLKWDIKLVKEEVKQHQDLQRKLVNSGRSSSNTGRSSAIDNIHAAMAQVVFDREEALGQNHTIMRHNTNTTSGTTSAAEAGTPIVTKRTFRWVMAGGENSMPDALGRLSRMQSILVSSARMKVPATEKQTDAFDRYVKSTEDFGKILETEMNILLNEQQRREEAAAAKEAEENPEGQAGESDSN